MSCGTGEQAYVHLLFPTILSDIQCPSKIYSSDCEGVTSRVLTSGSGAGSGAGNGLPQCLLQTTQWRSKVLMYCRAVGIQYV